MNNILIIISRIFLLSIIAQSYVVAQTTRAIPAEDEIYKMVEEMPRFPGCEDMDGSVKDKEICAKEKMLQYISENLEYPSEARENGIEGSTVVQFIISKTGTIDSLRLVRDIGFGCGDAALKVVRKMNKLPEKWSPGNQRGRLVRVLYTLPVRFKLDEQRKNPDQVTTNIDSTPFMEMIARIDSNVSPPKIEYTLRKSRDKKDLLVEPVWYKCKDVKSNEDQIECLLKGIAKYMETKIKYPDKAIKQGIHGKVTAQFVINTKGKIEDAKIIKDIGAGCGEEVLKAIRSMNKFRSKWVPAEYNGERVNYGIQVPFIFRDRKIYFKRDFDEKQERAKVIICSEVDDFSPFWKFHVYVNDQKLFKFKNKRYRSIELDEGSYKLIVHTGKKKKYNDTFNLDLKKGQTCFIKILEDKRKLTMMIPKYKFVEISKQEGMALVGDLKESK